MKVLKRVVVLFILVVAFIMMMCEPSEPQGDMTPYMSDVVMIPQKVYAKVKPKRTKKTTIKYEYQNLGKFTLTAYCGCAKCSGNWGTKTSTGTKCKAEHTIAVDPKKIPYGTEVVINGKAYVAEDCGGGVKGNHIDIYFDSHKEALDFGRQKATVYKRTKIKLYSKLKLHKGGILNVKFGKSSKGI